MIWGFFIYLGMKELTIEEKKKLCNYLQTFLTDERKERLQTVLAHRTRHFTVVLENLFQTQNISAVMRTCECYGVQDIHIIEKENEFTIHSAISMGSNKWLTLHNYPNEPHNAQKCIQTLKANGYTVVATMPSENSYFVQDLPIDQKTAFVFGTELTGISPELLSLCDRTVKIPMYGFTESFNISNSVAILLSNVVERLKKMNFNWALTPQEKEELYLEWVCKSIRDVDLIIENYLNKK